MRKHFEAEAASSKQTTFRPFGKRMEIRNGKPYVIVDHIRDLFDENENGKFVAASSKLRRGQYIFPTHYVHKRKKFVGETKDIRFSPEKGWEILLDGVLRNPKTGEPVLIDGFEVDCSGWYREDSLSDAKFGLKPIGILESAPSERRILESRDLRIRRIRNRG